MTLVYELKVWKTFDYVDDKKEEKDGEERAPSPPPPVPDVRQPENQDILIDDGGDDKSETAMTSNILGVKSPVKLKLNGRSHQAILFVITRVIAPKMTRKILFIFNIFGSGCPTPGTGSEEMAENISAVSPDKNYAGFIVYDLQN